MDGCPIAAIRCQQFSFVCYIIGWYSLPNTIVLCATQIASVDAGVFSGAPSVTIVKLCANQIETIDAKAFAGVKGLKRLELCNNVLATMPASFQVTWTRIG
jgi:hypothetical protein